MEEKLFAEFITLLRKKSESIPVIVEGKNDEKLLRRFGIKNIYTLSGKNYFDLVEQLGEQTHEVILLTDVDPQGEKIFKKLSQILEGFNVRVDSSFREYLKKLGVKEVEELKLLLFKG
ncbi:MAG: topoisomerase [Aquificaceae bacterium]|nr:MAG: topoisomerase [Aquificaceae bacterium]